MDKKDKEWKGIEKNREIKRGKIKKKYKKRGTVEKIQRQRGGDPWRGGEISEKEREYDGEIVRKISRVRQNKENKKKKNIVVLHQYQLI